MIEITFTSLKIKDLDTGVEVSPAAVPDVAEKAIWAVKHAVEAAGGKIVVDMETPE